MAGGIAGRNPCHIPITKNPPTPAYPYICDTTNWQDVRYGKSELLGSEWSKNNQIRSRGRLHRESQIYSTLKGRVWDREPDFPIPSQIVNKRTTIAFLPPARALRGPKRAILYTRSFLLSRIRAKLRPLWSKLLCIPLYGEDLRLTALIKEVVMT